jgi:hypothetical protein
MAFIVGFIAGGILGSVVTLFLCVKFFSLLKRIMFKP